MAESRKKKSRFREFYRRRRNKKIFWWSVAGLTLVVSAGLGLRYYLATMAERHFLRGEKAFKYQDYEKAAA